MSSLHLVDPGLLPLLQAFPTITLTSENLAERRARKLPFSAAGRADVVIKDRMVPGLAGSPEIRLRIYQPDHRDQPSGAIYHVHGGGYVSGSLEDADFYLGPLAVAGRCVIVSVDYRLAPEQVFPAQIEDCYTGLVWTLEKSEELNLDRARIGVMGESAGGGLAAALALLARDRGLGPLAFQHLVYPMLDDRTCIRPPHPFTGEFIWPASNNHFGWAALLGCEPGSDGVSVYAAPARAVDLGRLPPTFLMVGSLDLFLDETIDYARRLIAAGVPVELHVYPGAFHGFDLARGVEVADRATRDRRAALIRALR